MFDFFVISHIHNLRNTV